jgi:hypothetical protein
VFFLDFKIFTFGISTFGIIMFRKSSWRRKGIKVSQFEGCGDVVIQSQNVILSVHGDVLNGMNCLWG